MSESTRKISALAARLNAAVAAGDLAEVRDLARWIAEVAEAATSRADDE